MGVLVGAAPEPGWAVDPTEERGTEGATQGSSAGMGKQGKHLLGCISLEGSSHFRALQAEPPQDAQAGEELGHPAPLQPKFLP